MIGVMPAVSSAVRAAVPNPYNVPVVAIWTVAAITKVGRARVADVSFADPLLRLSDLMDLVFKQVIKKSSSTLAQSEHTPLDA